MKISSIQSVDVVCPSIACPGQKIHSLWGLKRVLWVGTLLIALVVLPLKASAYLEPDPPKAPHLLDGPSLFYEFNQVRIPDDAFPLQFVFLGEVPEELTREELAAGIEEAASTWSEVSCSYATLEFGGFRTVETLEPGEIGIRFREGLGIQADRYGWASISTLNPPEGLAIWLNSPRYRWGLKAQPFHSPPIIDLIAVLTHEIGHILGLAHTNAHGAATMWGAYLSDGSQRQLSADDKWGLCSLYPSGENECQSDQDCKEGGRCLGDEDVYVCDFPRGEPGEYCDLEWQHCKDRCHLIEEEIGIGICSPYCGEDSDCPSTFACIVDQNFCLPLSESSQSDRSGCVSSSGKSQWLLLLILLALVLLFRQRSKLLSPGL